MGLLDFLRSDDESNSMKIDMSNDTVSESTSVKFSSVNETTAMKITALNAGINLIANSVATLPIYLYKRDKNGERVRVNDDRNTLLNASPSATTTAMNLKYNIVKNLVLKGNSYVYIKQDKLGRILRLEYIDNSKMNIEKVQYEDGSVEFSYKFADVNGVEIIAKHHEIINLIKDNLDSNNPSGTGILETGQELINIAKSESQYTYSNLTGVNIKGYLASANKLSDNAKKNLKSSWRTFYSGADKNATPLLEDGLEFKQLNLKPAEIELIKSKEFTIKQISLLLNIPFSYLVDSASSYNNSQEEALRFLTVTLNPYIRLIEENFNKYLLTEKEKKQGYFFEFKTSELLRVSVKEQIEYLKTAVQFGLMTLAEARRQLNLEYREGSDVLLIPVNSATLKDGKIELISADNVDSKLLNS